MSKPTWKTVVFAVPLAAIALVGGQAAAGHRHRSDVVVTNSGGNTASFCTEGDVTVVHTARADAFGSYSIGYTVLQGPGGTYEMGQGSRVIPRGCYSHWLGNTTAVGHATVQSTVWYD